MDLNEFERIKDYTYLEYCDYLQNKYGIGLSDYMTKNYNKNPKCSRTDEGLFAHHKYEDTAIMLSQKEFAMNNPFEWQKAENIVYCDYLEHLLLHVLICIYPSPHKNEFEIVGVGGVVNFLVPELNDFYSGYKPKKEWKLNCYNKIIKNYDVYLEIIKMIFKRTNIPLDMLLSSFGELYGTWNKRKNAIVFGNIYDVFKGVKK